ncbi:hypothetical protein ADUPG1_006786, partial [Aduncisulcus paluster]
LFVSADARMVHSSHSYDDKAQSDLALSENNRLSTFLRTIISQSNELKNNASHVSSSSPPTTVSDVSASSSSSSNPSDEAEDDKDGIISALPCLPDEALPVLQLASTSSRQLDASRTVQDPEESIADTKEEISLSQRRSILLSADSSRVFITKEIGELGDAFKTSQKDKQLLQIIFEKLMDSNFSNDENEGFVHSEYVSLNEINDDLEKYEETQKISKRILAHNPAAHKLHFNLAEEVEHQRLLRRKEAKVTREQRIKQFSASSYSPWKLEGGIECIHCYDMLRIACEDNLPEGMSFPAACMDHFMEDTACPIPEVPPGFDYHVIYGHGFDTCFHAVHSESIDEERPEIREQWEVKGEIPTLSRKKKKEEFLRHAKTALYGRPVMFTQVPGDGTVPLVHAQPPFKPTGQFSVGDSTHMRLIASPQSLEYVEKTLEAIDESDMQIVICSIFWNNLLIILCLAEFLNIFS